MTNRCVIVCVQGEFEDVQCDDGECWCVDEFGIELMGTRGDADSVTSCQRLRNDIECPGLMCRLGCDYGFTVDNDTSCPLCECRDPCDHTVCPRGQQCQMKVSPCDDAPFCPALPYCVDVQGRSSGGDDLERLDDLELEDQQPLRVECPQGEPFVSTGSDVPLACNPRSRALTCPSDYSCHSEDDSAEGVCCPVQHTVKSGQCPFLVPVSVDTCDNECMADEDCDGTLKCCSNGCGTQCVEPLIKTSCQHQQLIMKYRARESGVPANRMFIPRCRSDDGSYEPVQCDPLSRVCWCVSDDGVEIAGTRVPPGLQPMCHQPRICPPLDCDVRCPHGPQIDTSGCPTCACRDPCQGVECRSKNEQCRVVRVNCIRQPCPPLPVCLPRLENPCSYGQPLVGKTNTSSPRLLTHEPDETINRFLSIHILSARN